MFELAPAVVHVADFLSDRRSAPRGHASDRVPRVAYADACHLARGLDLVEAPRQLLAKMAEGGAIELSGLRGREADCCGAAGLLPLTAPSAARAMGEARIHAFRDSGADELTMFSPRCEAHLRAIDPSLKIVDVSMLLARL